MPQRPNNFTINTRHPLAQGLVFAGLGAHAGSTRYHDSSAYGNTGTLTSMDPPTDWIWDTTLNRFVLDFDGSNDYGLISSNLWTAIPDPFTISMWQYVDSVGATYSNSIEFSIDSTHKFTWVISEAGGLKGGPRMTDGATTIKVQCPVTDTVFNLLDTWVHWSFVRVGSTGTLYRNGVPYADGGGSFVGYVGTTAWRMGGGSFNSLTFFDGTLADLLFHNRALSTSEIAIQADISNTMLSGLINYPRRKWWPVAAGGTPATFKAAWAARRQQVIGGGIT